MISKRTAVYIAVLGVLALVAMVLLLNKPAPETTAVVSTANDYKNISYVIEGERIQLVDGMAETEVVPGSASKITTEYFGNELKTDLNGDGREDVAFILTQSTGGSGTFYYAVAALGTRQGYVGSDGFLLGDRIAPQSTDISQEANQKYVVVFNYADRAPDEEMTIAPSVGKSTYLKLNPQTLQWGVVLSPEDRQSL